MHRIKLKIMEIYKFMKVNFNDLQIYIHSSFVLLSIHETPFICSLTNAGKGNGTIDIE